MSLPLSPVLIARVSGSDTVLTGNTGVDPNLLYYTFNAPGGGTVDGTYAIQGPNVGQAIFAPTGTIGPDPVFIIELIAVTADETDRHYQTYPEDEMELTYRYALDDSYPWRRTVVGGGEQISENVENTDRLNLRQLLMRNVAQVTDEQQQVYDVTGVDTAPGDRGYPILIQNTDDAIGQRPIGFQLIVQQNTLRRHLGPHGALRVDNPVGNQPDETEHSGPLSTILHVQLGDPYVVDSVRGVLVADGPAHWTKAQSESLVAWYHMGEHPQQPYLLTDYSDMALTETELEAGAFSSNYFLADRVWDSQRGWMLRLRGQAPTENPTQVAGFFKVNKNRLIGNNYTISFWAKNKWNDNQTHLPETLIFEYGPVVIKFGAGYGESLQTYIKDGVTGVLRAVGRPLDLNETTASFYSFSVSSLEPASTIPVDVCATTDISNLAGLQIIDGVQLIEGMTVLLIGQTDPTQNGHYFVYETGWIRVEAVDGVNELGLYFQVTGGVANAGLYQNTNISPFVYGSDGITYARYNVNWRGTMSQHIDIDTPDIFQPYQTSDTLLTFTAPQEDNSSDLIISDLKIWAIGKTSEELNIIQTPPFKQTAISARPTFFLSTRGAYRAFQVLSSGYVFPSIQAIDYYVERLARAIRYNGRGEYVGPDSRLLVGYGDWKPITSSMTLGLIGPDLKSQGTSVGASTSSDVPGFNTFWYADATLGFYRRVPVPYIAGDDSDNTTLVVDPTSSYHPTEMPVQNPGQARIFVPGEDGNMYKVVVHVSHLNAGDTVSLVAKLAGQVSLESQLTEQDYVLSAGETSIEIVTEPDFYDLIARYPSDDAFQQEFVTDAETLVSKI
jgi:hypothetical protein